MEVVISPVLQHVRRAATLLLLSSSSSSSSSVSLLFTTQKNFSCQSCQQRILLVQKYSTYLSAQGENGGTLKRCQKIDHVKILDFITNYNALFKNIYSNDPHSSQTPKTHSQKVALLNCFVSLGYELDELAEHPAVLRLNNQQLMWKTACLKMENREVNVEQLAAILQDYDPLPIPSENSSDCYLDHFSELASKDGVGEARIEKFLFEQKNEGINMWQKQSDAVVCNFLLKYLNIRPAYVLREYNAVRKLPLEDLVKEAANIIDYGIISPNQVLRLVTGIKSDVSTDRTTIATVKQVMALLRLKQRNHKEFGKSSFNEISSILKRGTEPIRETIEYLQMKGIHIQHIQRCTLILGYGPKAIENQLSIISDPTAKLLDSLFNTDKVKYLHVLFAIIDREHDNFYLMPNLQRFDH